MLALVVGGLIFLVSRVASFIVVVRGLKRVRPHARWSHFFAGLFLTVTGIWYLVNAELQLSTGDWLQDGWTWLTDHAGLD